MVRYSDHGRAFFISKSSFVEKIVETLYLR